MPNPAFAPVMARGRPGDRGAREKSPFLKNRTLFNHVLRKFSSLYIMCRPSQVCNVSDTLEQRFCPFHPTLLGGGGGGVGWGVLPSPPHPPFHGGEVMATGPLLMGLKSPLTLASSVLILGPGGEL